MEIQLTDESKAHLLYWQKTRNEKTLKRIREIIASIIETPFTGIGKPEPLKHHLSGKWSRRIDRENRIVYEVFPNLIVVHALKGHY